MDWFFRRAISFGLLAASTLYGLEAQGASLCIAHAGDQEAELENSLASFRSAYARGADGTELDVRHTKDKVAIVLHDETLSEVAESKPGRECPTRTRVSKLRFAEIRERCRLRNGEDVPTLAEVLDEFRDREFHLLLDFKDRPRDRTVRLVRRHRKHPGLRLHALVKFGSQAASGFLLGTRLGIPTYLTNDRYVFGAVALFDGFDVREISSAQIRRIRSLGKTISLYGADTEIAIRRAFDLGVELVTTDALGTCLALQRR